MSRPYEVKASRLGLDIAPEGYAAALPNVAGFVGADHMGVPLASRLWENEVPRMVIDIDTNGEISIGGKEGIASTSCAASPALEGGRCFPGGEVPLRQRGIQAARGDDIQGGGMGYEEFVRSNTLEPLGMRRSHLRPLAVRERS